MDRSPGSPIHGSRENWRRHAHDGVRRSRPRAIQSSHGRNPPQEGFGQEAGVPAPSRRTNLFANAPPLRKTSTPPRLPTASLAKSAGHRSCRPASHCCHRCQPSDVVLGATATRTRLSASNERQGSHGWILDLPVPSLKRRRKWLLTIEAEIPGGPFGLRAPGGRRWLDRRRRSHAQRRSNSSVGCC